MNKRKEQLLQLIIERYIEMAEPIGSKILFEEGHLGVSAATIRNEMRDLEERGYLTHPHTSAGRIPTELGYQYYLEHLLDKKMVDGLIAEAHSAVKEKIEDPRRQMKAFAKFAAEYSGSAVIIAFGRQAVYYTGMSQLFSQREFQDAAYTVEMSRVFDMMEDRIDDLLNLLTLQESTILLGSKNPFGEKCGLVGTKLDEQTAFMVFGPIRMDYRKAMSLLTHITK